MSLFKQDPECLSKFRAGERAALERTYRFYVRGVDAYVRVLAFRTAAADMAQPGTREDLVQEAFCRAFSERARRSYDGRREFRIYLHTLARNCFIDALRKSRREVLVAPESMPPGYEGVVVPAAVEPNIAVVACQYLLGLPEELQSIYEYRYVRGLSQVAACEALDLTRRQLRTGEFHLKRGLRRALVQAGVSLQLQVGV